MVSFAIWERLGLGPRVDPPEYTAPECPCCGQECDVYFTDINRTVIGCDLCYDGAEEYDDAVNAWEVNQNDRYWQ